MELCNTVSRARVSSCHERYYVLERKEIDCIIFILVDSFNFQWLAVMTEAATGVFKSVPPFGAIASMPSNAIYFGSILGFQRLCSKSLELIRRREDYVNEIFGFAMIYPYYRVLLNHSENRLIRHNRMVGGIVILSIAYANFLA